MQRDLEREVGLVLLGAALAGKAARKEVLEGVSESELRDEDLRRLMAALREYDGTEGTKVQQSLERWGVTVNGSILGSLREAFRSLSRERRILAQTARVNASRLNKAAFVKEVEELKKVLE